MSAHMNVSLQRRNVAHMLDKATDFHLTVRCSERNNFMWQYYKFLFSSNNKASYLEKFKCIHPPSTPVMLLHLFHSVRWHNTKHTLSLFGLCFLFVFCGNFHESCSLVSEMFFFLIFFILRLSKNFPLWQLNAVLWKLFRQRKHD